MSVRVKRMRWIGLLSGLASLLIGLTLLIAPSGVGAADTLHGHAVDPTPTMIDLSAPADGLAVDPTTDMIYDATGDGLQVIDGATNQLGSMIDILKDGGSPEGPAVDSRRDLIYVTEYETGVASPIWVVNGATDEVIRTFSADGPCEEDIAVNPTTDRLYVPINRTGQVNVFNAATGKLLAKINVGGRPGDVALDPTTDTIYVTHNQVGSISAPPTTVINGKTDKVIGHVFSGAAPYSAAVDPTTHRVYIPDNSSTAVYVLATSDHGLHTKSAGYITSVGGSPLDIAVDTSTHTLVVTDTSEDIVSILDGTTDKVLSTVTVGEQPTTVAVDSATHTAYVYVYGLTQLAVITGV